MGSWERDRSKETQDVVEISGYPFMPKVKHHSFFLVTWSDAATFFYLPSFLLPSSLHLLFLSFPSLPFPSFLLPYRPILSASFLFHSKSLFFYVIKSIFILLYVNTLFLIKIIVIYFQKGQRAEKYTVHRQDEMSERASYHNHLWHL